jgi:hypothetical protein
MTVAQATRALRPQSRAVTNPVLIFLSLSSFASDLGDSDKGHVVSALTQQPRGAGETYLAEEGEEVSVPPWRLGDDGKDDFIVPGIDCAGSRDRGTELSVSTCDFLMNVSSEIWIGLE